QLRQLAARRSVFTGARLAWRGFAVLVVLHVWLVMYAMAKTPQLYADDWYARGGLRRTAQIVATDVFGVRGTLALALVALVVALAGPPASWRFWPARIASAARGLVGLLRPVRVVATTVLSIGLLAVLWPNASGAQRSVGRPNVVILAADSLRADRL